MDLPPGAHRGVPFDTYRQIHAINVHGLMDVAQSPAHYWHRLHHPKPPRKAMRFGTLVHDLVLGLNGGSRYAVKPDVDRRTRDGKAEWAAWLETHQGCVHVDQADWDMACDMVEAVRTHSIAGELLRAGEPELTLVWDDDTGVRCKARLDWFSQARAIVELKTARNAAQGPFGHQSGDLHYHWQAAWYEAGAYACGLDPLAFIVVAVESAPPHCVAVYEPTEDGMFAARSQLRTPLREYAKCLAKGEWHGYPETIQPLPLPAWATYVEDHHEGATALGTATEGTLAHGSWQEVLGGSGPAAGEAVDADDLQDLL